MYYLILYRLDTFFKNIIIIKKSNIIGRLYSLQIQLKVIAFIDVSDFHGELSIDASFLLLIE